MTNKFFILPPKQVVFYRMPYAKYNLEAAKLDHLYLQTSFKFKIYSLVFTVIRLTVKTDLITVKTRSCK